MFGEILDALAKPIREGALSSLRDGASGGLVAQLEEIVGKFDALRGTRVQPSSPAPASASATETARPKRTPLAYELEIERMCAGDVRERAVRRDESARPETSEPPPKGEPPRETGSIPFKRPDPGLVALLEEIDRLDTLGLFRSMRSKPVSVAVSVPAEPVSAEPEPASPEHNPPPYAVRSTNEPAEPALVSIDRRRLARARMLRRRRALALAGNPRRPAKIAYDHPAMPEPPTHVSASASQHPIARGPPLLGLPPLESPRLGTPARLVGAGLCRQVLTTGVMRLGPRLIPA